MATNTKRVKMGDYICKIGKYDIRQKIEQSKTKKMAR